MNRAMTLLLATAAWLVALPAMAQQATMTVQSCGTLSNKNTTGSAGFVAVDINGNVCAGGGNNTPTSSANSGISSKTTTTAAASSLVLKAAAGNFYGAQVNTGGSAVWVLLVDGTADAGNGAVTGCGTGAHAAGCVAKWWQVPANSTLGISASPPLVMTTGAVLVCSSTGPFTETQSATCEFSGEVQ